MRERKKDGQLYDLREEKEKRAMTASNTLSHLCSHSDRLNISVWSNETTLGMH